MRSILVVNVLIWVCGATMSVCTQAHADSTYILHEASNAVSQGLHLFSSGTRRRCRRLELVTCNTSPKSPNQLRPRLCTRRSCARRGGWTVRSVIEGGFCGVVIAATVIAGVCGSAVVALGYWGQWDLPARGHVASGASREQCLPQAVLTTATQAHALPMYQTEQHLRVSTGLGHAHPLHLKQGRQHHHDPPQQRS